MISHTGCSPSHDRGVRIRPEEVAEQPVLRDLGRPLYFGDLVERREFGAEATVHGQDLVGDYGCHLRKRSCRGALPTVNLRRTRRVDGGG